MLAPEHMVKVRILGSRNQMKKVVSELYGMKLLHITEFPQAGKFETGKPFKEAEFYSKHLIKLRSMISFLGLNGDGKKVYVKANLKKLLKAEKEFEKLSMSLEKLKERKAMLEQAIGNPISMIATQSDKISKPRSLRTFVGVADKALIESIEESSLSHELVHKQIGNKIALIFTVPAKDEAKAVDLLNEFNFEEKQLPEMRHEDAAKELGEANVKISDIESKFKHFSKENETLVLNMEHSFTELIEKSEAPLSFMVSKRTFVVEGWVPKESYEMLERKISSAALNKVSLETLETVESPPIKLNNPKPAQPFEELLKMYAYPKIHEFDPTVILLFTFSAFFGFMLGDIGYGLFLLALSSFLFVKLKGAMKSISYVMIFCSLSAIVFGAVFGEFFGIEIIHPLIQRAHNVQTMILISVILGMIHITAGFALGFITKMKDHGFMHALFEKGSWILVEVAAVALALGIMMPMQPLVYAGGALMAVSVLMLLKGEGIKGVIELPGLLANVLSYIRLFAVGLASVSLAMVVNKLGGSMMQNGGLWIFAAAMVFTLGHAINIALGAIGPFLQTLRLHYFEFFAKFIEGGGSPYIPFGKIKKWR